MSATYPNTFITAFEREIIHDYQLMGGQLRKAVNYRTVSQANEARVNRLAAGVAQQKGRHADVPIMNLAHSTETIPLNDWFAAEMIDNLDELKNNVSYREDIKFAIVQALGRREDTIIVDELAANAAVTSIGIGVGAAAVSLAVLRASESALSAVNVRQSDRVGIISPELANQMRALDQVSSGDFVDHLKWENAPEGFRWHGHDWIVFNGLPEVGSTTQNFIVDRNNIAFRVLQDIKLSVDNLPMKDAVLLKGKMSMGAQFIQDDGIAEITNTTI